MNIMENEFLIVAMIMNKKNRGAPALAAAVPELLAPPDLKEAVFRKRLTSLRSPS